MARDIVAKKSETVVQGPAVPGEKLHLDTMGPFSTAGLKGEIHTLLVDISNFRWVFLVQSKHHIPANIVWLCKHIRGLTVSKTAAPQH